MASEPDRTALRQIDRLFQAGIVTGLDDGQLLDRFVADRDESALEALVEWHGPMVLGVCRRWLANPHDVNDAFQATFLILVRKARALRDVRRLGPWLHGVAYRVSARAGPMPPVGVGWSKPGPGPKPSLTFAPGSAGTPRRTLRHRG